MRSPLLLLALAVFAPLAVGQTITKSGPTLVNTGGNVWEVVYGSGNSLSNTRTFAKGTELGSAKATDAFSWVYKERQKIALEAARTVPAAAVGRVAAKLIPLVGPASVAYEVWDALGCSISSSGVVCNAESPETSTPGWNYSVGGSYATISTSAEGACNLYAGARGVIGWVISNPDGSQSCRTGRYVGDPNYFEQAAIDKFAGPETQGCPAGSVSLGNGQCSAGPPAPCDEDCLVERWTRGGAQVPGFADKAPLVVEEAEARSVPVPSSPPVVSGPSSVTVPGSTTTVTPPGGSPSSTVTNNTLQFVYEGAKITVTEVKTTTNADGTVTETADQPFPEWLCGVVGMPDCNVKVNETGTPEWQQPDNSELDEIKAADAAKMDEVAQTIPQPDLGWFDAPPIAACRPFVFPNDIGEVNPCGVVDSVRAVMAYLWALVAAWMAFGWIRQAVNGG